MLLFRKTVAILFLSFLFFPTTAQVKNPAQWSYSVVSNGDGSWRWHELKFDVKLEKGWHLYSPYQSYKEGDGPQAAAFKFKPNNSYKLIGKVLDGKVTIIHDAIFDVDVRYYDGKANLVQKISRISADAFTIKGSVSYQVCSEADGICIPLEEDFEFKIDADAHQQKINETALNTASPCNCDSQAIYNSFAAAQKNNDSTKVATTSETKTSQTPITAGTIGAIDDCSPWQSFWYGIAAGFLALIAPCVYSMLPLTTSFFVKQSKTKSQGIRKALLYGLFIILIFDAIGLIVPALMGADAAYIIASNVYVNLFLFLLFLVFAFSFLGAFEINLPSSWANKVDSASDRGGVLGIFFMALTLAVVSFSCTVPFIGTLMTLVAKSEILCPLFGFTGFGLSIALPFVLFAMFPTWLQSLPKSGGWMNTVKVVLGLLEIALAMKFLSNADQVGKWYLVSRELFIAIWIVCFGLMGFYLLGKLKFAHDSVMHHLSVTRTVFAVIVLSFTLYMVPGLWGAPVNIIAGFPPPLTEEWSENVNAFSSSSSSATSGEHKVNSAHSSRCPKGLDNCFHDYEEALAYAKKENKPLLLDFTGWTCLNCRKMEQNVWSKPQVLSLLREKYVLVSLYVDDRDELPADKQYKNKDGKLVTTVGKKWLDFEITRYGVNAQPYYVLLDTNEQLLANPVGYTPNVQEYFNYLNDALVKFQKK